MLKNVLELHKFHYFFSLNISNIFRANKMPFAYLAFTLGQIKRHLQTQYWHILQVYCVYSAVGLQPKIIIIVD